MAAVVLKLSFTYEKSGLNRFHSHHDMMRHLQRAVRRAGLPVRLTEGFNPQARIVFPHALGVGVASRCEEVEIEFTQPLAPDDVFETLREAVAPVIRLLSWRKLPPARKGRRVERTAYRLTGWPDPAAAEAAAASLAAETELKVPRGKPGKERMIDIRPFLREIRRKEQDLEVHLAHTATGAGRADEIRQWLCARLGIDPSAMAIEKVAMDLVF